MDMIISPRCVWRFAGPAQRRARMPLGAGDELPA
jgi:hypothetical protein